MDMTTAMKTITVAFVAMRPNFRDRESEVASVSDIKKDRKQAVPVFFLSWRAQTAFLIRMLASYLPCHQ
jgi:hypothetical protein